MRSGALAAAALLTACLVAACGSQHHASRTGASVVLPTAPPKVVHPVVHHRTHPAAASKPAAPFHARAELITHGPRRGHDVALTFDADMTQVMLSKVRSGLHSIGYDPEIVRELRASRTQATIFMTGPPCYGLPLVRSETDKRREVADTTNVLTGLIGGAPHYFRFPGGCHTAADVRLVASLGETPVQWDVVSGDPGQPNPAVVSRNVLQGARPGSIIVMHLVGAPNAPATAAALRTILPGLHQRGLHPVKLDELLGTGP